jgi:hypothetical protein
MTSLFDLPENNNLLTNPRVKDAFNMASLFDPPENDSLLKNPSSKNAFDLTGNPRSAEVLFRDDVPRGNAFTAAATRDHRSGAAAVKAFRDYQGRSSIPDTMLGAIYDLTERIRQLETAVADQEKRHREELAAWKRDLAENVAQTAKPPIQKSVADVLSEKLPIITLPALPYVFWGAAVSMMAFLLLKSGR